MYTPNEQITNILNYLLNEYSKFDENRKSINLQLCMNGNIQNAVGSWIKNFCIQRFKNKLWHIDKTIIVHTGNNEEKVFNKFDLTLNSEIVGTSHTNPYLNVAEHFICFVFTIEPTELNITFVKMKQFFKKTASQFPNIKMSITGDVELLPEKLEDYKYVSMISAGLNDVLKYDCTGDFRDEIVKCLGVQTKQQIIEKVSKNLTHILKNVDDND